MLKEDFWRKLNNDVKSENISSFRSFKKKNDKASSVNNVPLPQTEKHIDDEVIITEAINVGEAANLDNADDKSTFADNTLESTDGSNEHEQINSDYEEPDLILEEEQGDRLINEETVNNTGELDNQSNNDTPEAPPGDLAGRNCDKDVSLTDSEDVMQQKTANITPVYKKEDQAERDNVITEATKTDSCIVETIYPNIADEQTKQPEVVVQETEKFDKDADVGSVTENIAQENAEGLLQETTSEDLDISSAIVQDTSENNDGIYEDAGSEEVVPEMVSESANLEEILLNTNMASIPQILEKPYLLFFDASQKGNYQICDANGSIRLTISGGSIIDTSYVITGHITTDNRTKETIIKDMENNPMYCVDSHGQIFSGDCYIGRISTIDNYVNIRDFRDQIIAVQDKATGIWQTLEGKVLGSVRAL